MDEPLEGRQHQGPHGEPDQECEPADLQCTDAHRYIPLSPRVYIRLNNASQAGLQGRLQGPPCFQARMVLVRFPVPFCPRTRP